MTIQELLEHSKKLLQDVKQITNRIDYKTLETAKNDLLSTINDSLETGYFTGIDRDMILQAKHNTVTAEAIATKIRHEKEF